MNTFLLKSICPFSVFLIVLISLKCVYNHILKLNIEGLCCTRLHNILYLLQIWLIRSNVTQDLTFAHTICILLKVFKGGKPFLSYFAYMRTDIVRLRGRAGTVRGEIYSYKVYFGYIQYLEVGA